MALFVQIDHFRKTDQKPTVKNHLFSISWFRSFNRTSFQQQLKRINRRFQGRSRNKLQSYILSTTTETPHDLNKTCNFSRFNRTSFQQQLKRIEVPEHSRPDELQSYILSTTTETFQGSRFFGCEKLQSYILSTTTETHSKKRENSAPDQTQPNF